MAGRGQRPKINWALILQAISLGFTLLVVVVGGLMGWSYLNGATAARVEALENKVRTLEGRRQH